MNKRNKPTKQQLTQLWDACVAHIDKHEVRCAESCYQMDNVVLAAPELTESVGDIVGYWEDEDDDA